MIYLGLGTNCGDRRQFLTTAIEKLETGGFQIKQVSPLVESPALLKEDAKPQWSQPFLNLVLEGETDLSPHELLALAKKIEQSMGRDLQAPRWSPRNIDIDLLLWDEQKISTAELTIPHPEMHKRTFVMTPLMHVAPHLQLPGLMLTPMQISEQIRPIPLWMGIVNVSSDSFSDGGVNGDLDELESRLDKWINEGVQILDFGAESTRPGALEITAQVEWLQLEPVFTLLDRLRKRHALMPLVSIDTRNASTARRALEKKADWINDVTGLGDARMLALVQDKQATSVAMHSLSVPVKPGEALDSSRSVEFQVSEWLQNRAQCWEKAGLSKDRIIFDPGIGFGKSVLQNLNLIKSIARLRKQGFRVLAGHSRKSFMNTFTDHKFADRDIETLGLSLAMCEQGVDILRVHDPVMHIRAYRAWAHAQT